MSSSPRWVFFEDEDGLCELELVPGLSGEYHLCVHTKMYNLSPSSVRKAKKVFNEAREFAREHDFESGLNTYTEDLRWAKLVAPDFEVLGNIDKDGRAFTVVQWND